MLLRIHILFLLIPIILFFSCFQKAQVEFLPQGIMNTCYDFKFAHLNLNFNLSYTEIKGSNTMYFDAICSVDSIVVDLFENFHVDSVLLNDHPISFFRKKNEILIIKDLDKESSFVIEVFYSGFPTIAKNPPWSGGIVLSKDHQNLDWLGVACQKESGAIWFPSKHDLSDEPDSMRISLSVPMPYLAISNGTLMSVQRDKNYYSNNIFEWFVANPINNYNVTFNIAKYENFRDTLMGCDGYLQLDYYVLRDNLNIAKEHFKQVKPMLHVFENLFGPYPFYQDGYKLVETSYLGMEHQSCISYGNQFMKGYLGSFPDTIDFDFIIIHETAHEWWGNSLTMESQQDMWIHESFATYSEALYVEEIYGYDAMLRYLNYQKDKILNQEPIIHDMHNTTDMYYKGSWILHTLRTIVDDDDLWYDMLIGLQLNFKHQIVNTEAIIQYIIKQYGYDLSSFFEQYLFCAQLPIFEYLFVEKNNSVRLDFRWNTTSSNFEMPLLVKINNLEGYTWIYPNQEWNSIALSDIEIEEFKIASELFLIETRLVE